MTNILLEIQQHIAEITINRPDKLNALNRETIAELSQCLDELSTNSEVRCIIIAGSGTKAFVAGADISEFASFSIEEGKKLSALGHKQLFDKVEQMNKPVIAAVNGFALGGGLELAMACHFRYASTTAKMGLPEVTLGVIPGYGGTQRLPQLIGKGRANELIFTGKMLSAQEALAMGLVNQVCEADQLLEACRGVAQKISTNSPTAITAAIKAVNAGFETGVNGYEAEISAFGESFGTADFKEGTSAFLEKRKPNFSGK